MPRVDTDAFYRLALERYGHNAEGAHWESAHTQRVRFDVLRRLLPADPADLTLVDVGCGMGDFYTYLKSAGALPGRYLGIDVVAPMVELARARTRQEILLLDALQDPLPEADYYVCSGAMNTFTRDETRQFIARCLAASRGGFLFNLLRGLDDCDTFNYWEPDEMLALAQDLGAVCAIETGYLREDFTVVLRRARRP
ncbi:class I SAM-dependent methyltransferase [uncultured Lamprocystis sp.]|jgi:SAM-dependent methyltransferase|uniref:class I SAM-dependent methyltransferase n=1 Tax=uncultured Lamprocystis sp. TaxID=543132 RepID=UPI0025F09F3A|nr:class I SAM-dependent methyltransferase [uncultured Lamprocystis sp.]